MKPYLHGSSPVNGSALPTRLFIRRRGAARSGSAFGKGAAGGASRLGEGAHRLDTGRIMAKIGFTGQDVLPDIGGPLARGLPAILAPGAEIRPVGDKRFVEFGLMQTRQGIEC